MAIVNNVDASAFVLKTKYQTDKTELKKKIPNASDLVKKTDYTARISTIEGKIPSISDLATKTTLTTVKNKIPSVHSLVKKTDYDTKITEIEKKLIVHNYDKYITTPEFNSLVDSVFNARLAQANLMAKTDFDAKLSSINRKITDKHLLIENELKKLKTFDLSYSIGKSHFEEDETQNYLVFQPIKKYSKIFGGKNKFHLGNPRDDLVKALSILLHLIIVLLH